MGTVGDYPSSHQLLRHCCYSVLTEDLKFPAFSRQNNPLAEHLAPRAVPSRRL